MANSLQALFDAIANANNEQELRLAVTDTVGLHFGVQHCAIHIFDEQCPEGENDNQSIPDVCIERNPVWHYLLERHAPVHEELVLPSGGWKQFCSRSDHEHVMTGPIVEGGKIIGTVNFTRAQGADAFDANDLADLSALCLHLSAKLANLRAKPKTSDSPFASRLTPRELEIAELVGQGLTNGEIGEKLWISQNSVKQALKRMFRKLEVSARAEMVAKLQDVVD
ncbi:MAG: LuxR family transcriptional regulator [Cyanomargarita calcarea GSE-NOS-MK-12-04C]|jgi:DNA-binding CsgD family transcriptional regulator|uniref:LuxR family transcriptional regulator n=1 Tax=Cyanomargarita calcarea GSE-NOS-MK-12-04C TaxID=2839659 RepID=A0A951QSW2_9CYAN|nr:LuxR family transcriptional regulator [Cyanomargarita calcarea GSE-NOS-MK-12-04C]